MNQITESVSTNPSSGSQVSIMSGYSDCTGIVHIEYDPSVSCRICLVGNLAEDKESTEAAKFSLIKILKMKTRSVVLCPEIWFSNSQSSKDGLEYAEDKEFVTYFIVSDFDTEEFERLQKLEVRIFGKPAFVEMSLEGVLSYRNKPVYCLTMRNCVVVFTGFRKRSEISKLLKLVHYMGGSIKNEINEKKVTHLIAYSSTGEKYHYAATFDIPVMGEDWINSSWAHRDEIKIKASDPSFLRYKLKLFHNLKIVLVGFSDEDRTRMNSLIKDNGGFSTNLEDNLASHVVVDDQMILEKPSNCPEKALVVKAEWFWASIQMNACVSEQNYLYDPLSFFSPRSRVFSPGTPGSRSRRRKRLRETVQQLAENDSPSGLPTTCPPASKRRSSVGDLAFLSSDGSFLEDSLQSIGTPCLDKTPLSPPSFDLRLLPPRHRVFQELVKTECNYVAILDTINKLIKEPLENPNQPGGPMLDSQELRYIFGNLPPIHEVHTKLRNDLLHLSHHWSDDMSIGKVILNYTTDLEKAYPPFVNYFENVKETLKKITTERPRFHAFLKIAQNKPECGRQNFQELLIRPVQRLPSMSLLINDILKHTDKSSPDHSALQEALDKIKSIMTFINDDKRKTEAKLKLFEIHNDIENCPPNLVASHRTYVSKVDVTELSDSCSGRGDSLSLFLFNDIVEICKRKSKYNSIKSPSRVTINTIKIKSYKHLEMMSLSHIKRVVDIRETEDCRNVFALIVRSNQEFKERLFTFTLIPEDITKAAFLKELCSNMASVLCRSDVENFLVPMDPHHLDIDTSDVNITNALSKALRYYKSDDNDDDGKLLFAFLSYDLKSSFLSLKYKNDVEVMAHYCGNIFATRTGRKVSRAFSFNKSPSKLKRAVSTVMSPFANSSSQGMRGATSVNNLAVSNIDIGLSPH
ncbi:Protein ECT2 [Armadillidium vulgare]|nr:Protein ECT2 [Armadillidium vulgare]